MKVPCEDERDFYARLADRIAANGLRIPVGRPRPVGTRMAVTLEFRNGQTLGAEGVIDAHVQLDPARAGVNVRRHRLDRGAGAPAPTPPPRAPPPPPSPAGPPALGLDRDEPLLHDSSALVESLFDEVAPGTAGSPGDAQFQTGSAELIAQVRHRTARAQWAAIAVAALALVLAIAAYALLGRSGGPAAAKQAVAAHLEAADRLFAAGRLTGADGALEHLLLAKQLSPADPETDARLRRAADVLESLGTRALERGDGAVASIHLAAAKLADPARQSIRVKMERVERLRSAGKRR
ncbi:MAG TPA: hypothetical protein VLT61_00365 [Anaeromyxobacteraceae bacterium]|nr:hypothetical protein [Anaeromyxobacteraceae bacterium]